MSNKFNEILNSSDASDALLGEQIDKVSEKLNGLIKEKTITATTDANGYIVYSAIGLSKPNIIISTYLNNTNTVDSSRYCVVASYGTSNVTYSIKCCNHDGSAFANKSVTVTIYYI